MADDNDYRNIAIPDDMDPEDYDYRERRAEILERMQEAGHPDNLNQTELAEEFGVSQPSISKDFKRLRQYITGEIDTDRVEAITQMVFTKAIKNLQEEGDHLGAVEVVEKWNDWLYDRGKMEREPERSELHVDGKLESESTQKVEHSLTDEDRALLNGMFGEADATDDDLPEPDAETQ